MSENNKSYRIRTNVGSEYNGEIKLNVNLLQDYDEFEILSLKIGTENLYKYHTANYGCIVGRVLANGGVGVPNVKISAFIPVEDVDTTDPVMSFLYPYSDTRDKNRDNIRYNLLTDTKIDDCHQSVGTFPNKRLVLDDNNVIEVYDKYYKFTTTTNGSGDYMLFGLPVGNNIIHSDLDLSDIGILSQKPRDLFYKGYTAKQFENASQFKKDTNLDNLTQVISQDSSVYVFPFWGDETENEGQIKIVRNDIDVNYKFEPTCIFIGCIVSDEKSNAISKNCIPHERMGKMDRLMTGAGTIEMIRKTISGGIESYTIQGNELIDGNGTWCYQIPMNLDYMTTDEYGVLVPTDDYEKGIPTRASVRFRVSLADYESDYENAHLVKVLVPNNPKVVDDTIDYDYEFGSATRDDAFRDMFWNNVYTVKSYIPRFQKGNRQRNKNFTGFKAVNVNGANNPIPYNNMRINFTFLFVFQCLIFKSLVLIVKTLNKIIQALNRLNCAGNVSFYNFACEGEDGLVYLTLDGGMCPTLEGNYIAPGAENDNLHDIIRHTYKNVYGEEYDVKFKIDSEGREIEYDNPPDGKFVTGEGTALPYDQKSADGKNSDLDPSPSGVISSGYVVEDIAGEDQSEVQKEKMRIYNQEDYFVKCVELQFAMEYEVIQFDFYNDWINGMIYIPRWFAEIKKNKDYAYYCGDTFFGNRYLTQQCSIAYSSNFMLPPTFPFGCRDERQQCHKRFGRKNVKIFGKNRGVVVSQKNSREQYAYYLKPSELVQRKNDNVLVKVNLFPTDIVLMGSVTDCNQYGIPKVNGYTSSTYRMPPPTAEIISDSQEMNFVSAYNKQKVLAEKMIKIVNTTIYERVYKLLNMNYYPPIYTTNSYTGVDYYGRMDDAEKATFVNCTGKDLSELFVNRIPYEAGLCFYNTYCDEKDKISLPPKEAYIENTEKYWVDKPCDNLITDILYDAQSKCVSLGEKILSYNNSRNQNKLTILNYLGYGFNGIIPASDDDLKQSLRDLCPSQESDDDDTSVFYGFDKKTVFESQLPLDSTDLNESTYAEISGIDWGYNPFTIDSGSTNDDTTIVSEQIAGHFLEIGCTFSLSNVKSCVNLQRVCELGGELSQSHYYRYKDSTDGTYKISLYDPTGIISKREVADEDIRTTFATLNSKNLGVIYDSSNGYKKYSFQTYAPVSFMGELSNRNEIIPLKKANGKFNNYGLIETQSKSYRSFRFNTTNQTEIAKHFLIRNDVETRSGVKNLYFIPMYENSFYFYFGLRDGNTAIDRLYSEYYAKCDKKTYEQTVSFNIEQLKIDVFRLHYNTENMNMIKSITVKRNGVTLNISTDTSDSNTAKWDKKHHTIDVYGEGIYLITLKDIDNLKTRSIVRCYYNPSTANDPLTISWNNKVFYSGRIDSNFNFLGTYDSMSEVAFSNNESSITSNGVNFIISGNAIYDKCVTGYTGEEDIDFGVTIKNAQYSITFECQRYSVKPYPTLTCSVESVPPNDSGTFKLYFEYTNTDDVEPTVSVEYPPSTLNPRVVLSTEGDAESYDITYFDSDGDEYFMTGWEITMSYERRNQGDYVSYAKITVTDGRGGWQKSITIDTDAIVLSWSGVTYYRGDITQTPTTVGHFDSASNVTFNDDQLEKTIYGVKFTIQNDTKTIKAQCVEEYLEAEELNFSVILKNESQSTVSFECQRYSIYPYPELSSSISTIPTRTSSDSFELYFDYTETDDVAPTVIVAYSTSVPFKKTVVEQNGTPTVSDIWWFGPGGEEQRLNRWTIPMSFTNLSTGGTVKYVDITVVDDKGWNKTIRIDVVDI